MPQYVSESVQDTLANPDGNKRIELVIGVEEGYLPSVREWITANEGVVKQEAPFNLLLLEIPETRVAGLTEQEGVESVETNEGIKVLNSGNPHSPWE